MEVTGFFWTSSYGTVCNYRPSPALGNRKALLAKLGRLF
jgi:hypothetical protein